MAQGLASSLCPSNNGWGTSTGKPGEFLLRVKDAAAPNCHLASSTQGEKTGKGI